MSVRKVALITGITGQDGSYLAEFLLGKGYIVHGLVRRVSQPLPDYLNRLRQEETHRDRIFLHSGDVTDSASVLRVVLDSEPDEIYNLAAQSDVRQSFDQPALTLSVVGLGTLNLLEAARALDQRKPVRFYQASSSEMFGMVTVSPQNERTPFNPQSPYACAKVYAHFQTANYRRAYQLFAVSGILFNHESPRRGENFVTRKITRAATRIKLGLQDELRLGNLDACRDWGYAPDYVEAMWLMLQQEEPDDFVIATRKSHSVRDVLDRAFTQLELDWRKFVRVDESNFRPSDVPRLVGDFSKAQSRLGWAPSTSFDELIRKMVGSDLELAERESEERADGDRSTSHQPVQS